MIITETVIKPDNGKAIYDKVNNKYYTTAVCAVCVNVDNLEDCELSDINKYTRQEYEDKVAELVAERYSFAKEASLNRQRFVKVDEFKEYFEFAEDCKKRAKEILNK